jgi:subtilase family serine protease
MREDKISVLAPGEETAERTINISLIDYQRKDIEYFDIIADPNNNVIETNEQNNNLQL